jgi:hypothetical protein
MGTSINLRSTVTVEIRCVFVQQVEDFSWKPVNEISGWFMVWNEFQTMSGQPLQNVRLLIQNDLREKQLKKISFSTIK